MYSDTNVVCDSGISQLAMKEKPRIRDWKFYVNLSLALSKSNFGKKG